jgi:hypothetical protein
MLLLRTFNILVQWNIANENLIMILIQDGSEIISNPRWTLAETNRTPIAEFPAIWLDVSVMEKQVKCPEKKLVKMNYTIKGWLN